MHPLRTMIEAAVAGGLDFLLVVGGDKTLRLKMGLPSSVAEKEPLLLTFPAAYHRFAKPTCDDDGLYCELSFDSLYSCRMPLTAIQQVVVQSQAVPEWPSAWRTDEEKAEEAELETPMPDNVRLFRPRPKRDNG